ncbi:MAG TPA: Fic family protein, partial [Puia sp.]|nr:Fic family protein [Puia sp.]
MNTSTIHITPEILSLIGEIDEFEGAWRALGQLAPEQLTSLKRVATIESIGSSTRIEGSKLRDKDVEILLSHLQIKKFTSRDEQEVAGHAEVMNTIFQHHDTISLTENYIKQFHRDLLKYSDKDTRHRGEYKKHSNHVEAFDSDGKSLGIVFETASPFDTPFRMQHLVEWANESMRNKSLHPLLVTAVFIVEFLAIHPFQDGNRLIEKVTLSKLDGSYIKLLNHLERQTLIILDDFGLQNLGQDVRLTLLQLLEDRYGRKSIIITSQLPV